MKSRTLYTWDNLELKQFARLQYGVAQLHHLKRAKKHGSGCCCAPNNSTFTHVGARNRRGDSESPATATLTSRLQIGNVIATTANRGAFPSTAVPYLLFVFLANSIQTTRPLSKSRCQGNFGNNCNAAHFPYRHSDAQPNTSGWCQTGILRFSRTGIRPS